MRLVVHIQHEPLFVQYNISARYQRGRLDILEWHYQGGSVKSTQDLQVDAV